MFLENFSIRATLTFGIFCFPVFQENELGEMRPVYIKAKEKTAHVTKRLETKK
jgi:hypothetical protein